MNIIKILYPQRSQEKQFHSVDESKHMYGGNERKRGKVFDE